MKKNILKHTCLKAIRPDAFLLAILLFIQTIAPTFLYGREENLSKNRVPLINTTVKRNVKEKIIDKPFREKKKEKEKRRPTTAKDKPENLSQQKVEIINPIKPGGPDQPEVQSFTPIGVDNMVDPFTGDFSYNIPLLEIDGYPINIAYNAGVGMEQEASWVGLGWGLNPGVVNRNMRGIPDDFKGDKIKKEFNQKPNWSVGVSTGLNWEVFGFNLTETLPDSNIIDTVGGGGLNISAKLGIQYNNYNGYGSTFSLGPAFNIAKKAGFDVGLEFTGSSQEGATIGLHAGYDNGKKKSNKKMGIGSSVNSRHGLQQVSIEYSFKKVKEKRTKITDLKSSFNVGMSTYVPNIPFDRKTTSFTASFKTGVDIFGSDPVLSISGFFNKSSLKYNSKSVASYGYQQLQHGQTDKTAMLDFNRENEGSFTKNTPALPIPFLTYDLFSVKGNGVSGSYRLDRRDIGYVFDATTSSSSISSSVGAEVGLGSSFKAGVDVDGAFTKAESGAWYNKNAAKDELRFTSKRNYFRNANELSYDDSETAFNLIGGTEAVRFKITTPKKLSNLLKSSTETISLSNSYKSLRFQRNQPLVDLSIKEVKNEYGMTKLPDNSFANLYPFIDHHIGAFNVTKMDGSRYYYGLPAYSIKQKNVTFAVGEGKQSGLTPDWSTNLVSYTGQDASIGNEKGLDNYYNAETTPAYAHSYMLTAVLGPNYVDSDNIFGPSKNDLGSYVEFKYKQIPFYKWRNPVNVSKASFDRGLNSDPTDDKANYIYGEKELWYLDTIKGKNHLLIFYTSNRKDAVSVNSEMGGIDAGNTKMQKLDSIKLFSRPDFDSLGIVATPIKTVHFKYDYSLCRDYAGNHESGSSNPLEGGKLTLKEVYFTYKNSYKGERTPYVFNYGYNPLYNSSNIDRWGTYKPNPSGLSGNEATSPLSNAYFPYVGHDKASTDLWASAWNLEQIILPSGGKIEIDYESDDYAYVQHKKATQMFKIVDVEDCLSSKCSISDDDNRNRKLYFDLLPNTTIEDYGSVGDEIYFRALLSMNKDATDFDYVPGYAVIKEMGTENGKGYVQLKPSQLKDNGSTSYSPISVAGVQFARNYLSRLIPPSSQANPQSEDMDFLPLAYSLLGAFTSYGELFTGPNKPLWNKEIGTILIKNKSWIRLKTPNNAKLGGGHRVKEIRTYDSWDEMNIYGQESYYGQEYQYNFEGKSSGVAAYEPQIGGEENVWRTYVANDIKMTLAPDIRNYMETPFGEQLFPSPTVGYSKVLVKNIEREGVTKTATGHTINSFYTAKDFPTITKKTDMKTKGYNMSISASFLSMSRNRMAASQGFTVENNDMHGKPEATEIYAENQDAPYSSVRYDYQFVNVYVDGIPAKRLDNKVKVILPSGATKKVTVGRTYEAVADFREKTSRMTSGGIAGNLNVTLPFVFAPIVLPAGISNSKNEVRSAVFAKSIERKGILYKTVAKDYGATIETENLAYDSETGEVLLTSVNNDYKDTIYNFTYPAHWIYEGMGQASKNLGFKTNGAITFVDGYCAELNNQHLFEGDRVVFLKNGSFSKGWVTESKPIGVRILSKNGAPVNGTVEYLKVVRSGHRNLQTTPVGTVSLMTNPLNSLTGNTFDEVLNAQSIEYDQNRRTYCECNDSIVENPYVAGLKGNWSPKATYLHLSGRTQTFENENTNIRRDGLMESYLPFFRLSNGDWSINKENWTFTSEVTEFSPFGQQIETVDALNRFSATQIGYNQTLPVAITANSQRKESGFDGFEDYLFESCPDKHFRIGDKSHLNSTESHTGRYSITVNESSPVIFQRQLNQECETIDPCDFSQYVVEENNQTKIYLMEDQGINMSYETIFGSPAPNMIEISGGVLLSFNSSQPFKVEVKLINEAGCMNIVPIEETAGN